MAQLDHINMSVKNLNESIQWYNKVFQFQLVEQGRSSGIPYAILKSGESMLCIYEQPGLKNPADSKGFHRTYHFGLRITDRESWENTVKEEKVDVDHEWKYPHSYSWYVNDPSGHEIEVVLWDKNQIQF